MKTFAAYHSVYCDNDGTRKQQKMVQGKLQHPLLPLLFGKEKGSATSAKSLQSITFCANRFMHNCGTHYCAGCSLSVLFGLFAEF